MAIDGMVFDIQRFSLHDGPGIRTTVFLKGCPLRCRWCHNPEGLEVGAQIRLSRNLCTGCGRCAQACAHGGHELTAEGHLLHLEACTRCGQCVEACYAGALELVGKRLTVEEVLAVVRRDLPFYQHSGGGMTLSGGEPLAQYDFTRALLAAAKAEGLHTAIETTAYLSWEHLEPLFPLVDLFLLDLKHTDEARHRALTGLSNRTMLANIRRMAAAGWPVTLRIPWVPRHNAEPAFLDGLLAYLREFPSPPPVTFLPYHRLGIGKWAAINGVSPMPDDLPAATAEDVQPWINALHAAGISASAG